MSVHIESTNHFKTVLSSSTYVVADFYADWCGPCKQIGPIFEQLAKSESKPGKLAFVKVNVDTQQAIARTYGVSAMPTFLILKNAQVADTIRGADPSGLRSAVMKAASDAARGSATSGPAFQSKGQRLGGADSPSTTGGGGIGFNLPAFNFNSNNPIIRFVALYVTSFFAFDSYAAAATSQFALTRR